MEELILQGFLAGITTGTIVYFTGFVYGLGYKLFKHIASKF